MLRLAILSLLVAASAAAQGLDDLRFDSNVRPQDDLYAHVNGVWERDTPIPAGMSDIGSFPEVDGRLRDHVLGLLQNAAAGTLDGEIGRALGQMYLAATDAERIEALGIEPLGRHLAQIESIDGPEAVARYIGRSQALRADAPFSVFVHPDARDTERYRPTVRPGGLGIGPPPFYRAPPFEDLRTAYKAYAEALFQAAGHADPAGQAARAYALEERLAGAQMQDAHRMQSLATLYNRLPLAEADSAAPAFDWRAFYDGMGVDVGEPLVVWLPGHAAALGEMTREVPAEDWRAYFTLRLLDGYATALPSAFRDAHFAFHGRAKEGATAPPTADELAVALANSAIGWTVAQAYVDRHFDPAVRQRVEDMAAQVRDAFVAAVERNDWMSPETKAEALAKAQGVALRIGYPNAWPDERAVRPEADDLLGTLARADELAWTRQTDRLGTPYNGDNWAFLPQTFFAYYATPEPGIVFPAGILQPPFFWPEGDDAAGYGSIGVVIGHELTHGFDNRGRLTDARGDLRDWWAPEDAAEYDRRARQVVEQFGAEEPLPGLRINGQLTLGENLADLAGTMLALAALEQVLAERGEALTDDHVRRFFVARARMSRGKHRPEHLRQSLMTQPHAPGRYRVNLIAEHLDAFHRAFGTAPGDGMWRAPEDRVRIW